VVVIETYCRHFEDIKEDVDGIVMPELVRLDALEENGGELQPLGTSIAELGVQPNLTLLTTNHVGREKVVMHRDGTVLTGRFAHGVILS